MNQATKLSTGKSWSKLMVYTANFTSITTETRTD